VLDTYPRILSLRKKPPRAAALEVRTNVKIVPFPIEAFPFGLLTQRIEREEEVERIARGGDETVPGVESLSVLVLRLYEDGLQARNGGSPKRAQQWRL
jgi:hypothetical protein